MTDQERIEQWSESHRLVLVLAGLNPSGKPSPTRDAARLAIKEIDRLQQQLDAALKREALWREYTDLQTGEWLKLKITYAKACERAAELLAQLGIK